MSHLFLIVLLKKKYLGLLEKFAFQKLCSCRPAMTTKYNTINVSLWRSLIVYIKRS